MTIDTEVYAPALARVKRLTPDQAECMSREGQRNQSCRSRAHLETLVLGPRIVAALSSLESLGAGHGRPLAATLVKMLDEYALHSGQVHMLRFAVLGGIIR